MLVKFANCEVPIWKLRRGVVLSPADSWSEEPVYVHLEGFKNYHDLNYIAILVLENGELMQYSPANLNWLEP